MNTSVKIYESIGFGSCNRQNLNQSFWKDIQSNHLNMKVWLWMGDAYYTPNNTIEGQTHAIQNLKDNLFYSQFKDSIIIEGVFDDHDYGVNDAGKHITNYEQRKQQYLDFLYHSQPKKNNNNAIGKTNILDAKTYGFVYDTFSPQLLSSSSNAYVDNESHEVTEYIEATCDNDTCNSNQKVSYHHDNSNKVSLPPRGVYKSFDLFLSTQESDNGNNNNKNTRNNNQSEIINDELNTIHTGKPLMAKVKVVMLDTRSFRDAHYIPSLGEFHFPSMALVAAAVRLTCAVLGIGAMYEGDVLGEEQWLWLEDILRNSQEQRKRKTHTNMSDVDNKSNVSNISEAGNDTTALRPVDYHVIVSSIQVLTSNPVVESWGHFPYAKQRLLNLLKRYDPVGLVLLSGDVHHAELLQYQYPSLSFQQQSQQKQSSSLSGSAAATSDSRTVSSQDKDLSKYSNVHNILSPKSQHYSLLTLHDHQHSNSMQMLYEVTSSGLTHACGDGKLTHYLCPWMLDTFHSHRHSSSSSSGINNISGDDDLALNETTTKTTNSPSSSTNSVQQYFIGRNYGIFKLQRKSSTSSSIDGSNDNHHQQHELNVSVYDIKTHMAVLTQIVSNQSSNTFDESENYYPMSDVDNSNDTSESNCSYDYRNAYNNSNIDNDDDRYARSFDSFSQEQSINIVITLLALCLLILLSVFRIYQMIINTLFGS